MQSWLLHPKYFDQFCWWLCLLFFRTSSDLLESWLSPTVPSWYYSAAPRSSFVVVTSYPGNMLYRILSSCKSVKITKTAFPKPETTGPIKKYIVWQNLFVWLSQWNYSNTPWENIYLLSKIYKMLHVLKRSWKFL